MKVNANVAKRVLEGYLQEKNILFMKEYQFAKDRKFRLDYYLPDYKLAIEFEGGIWTNGRHTRGSGFIKDTKKYNLLTLKGIWLFRVVTDTINDGSFFTILDDFFVGEKPTCGAIK